MNINSATTGSQQLSLEYLARFPAPKRSLIRGFQELFRDPKKPKKLLNSLHNLNPIRDKRLERLSAISAAAELCLGFVDQQGGVGFKMRGEEYFRPTFTWLANTSGLCLKRIKRAMRDMIRAGYLTILRLPLFSASGSVVGRKPSILKFTEAFWNESGLREKFQDWANWIRKKEKRMGYNDHKEDSRYNNKSPVPIVTQKWSAEVQKIKDAQVEAISKPTESAEWIDKQMAKETVKSADDFFAQFRQKRIPPPA